MSVKPEYADFLFWESDWLYQQFRRLEFVRSPKYFTLKVALNLFLQNDGKLIVETGTQRLIDDPGGCSTLLFGAFCKRYKKRLITVDISPENIEVSKQATQEYKDYITYVVMDSVKFLTEFNEGIDLLYLDSLDCPFDYNNPSLVLDATKSQTHNLKELQAAYNKLHKGSVLLADDNNFANGGKTRLSKRFLLVSQDWQCILDHGQTLWVKNK